jgi:hypothetical protein
MTGVVVGVPIFFTDRTFILDFTSIGTLFAFALVCGGVLVLPPRKEKTNDGKFRLPYVNAQYIVPALVLLAGVIILIIKPALITDTFSINADNAVKNIPMLVFYLSCIFLAIMSYVKKYSLIPVLGLLSCIYLFTGFSIANWKYFGIWLIIGLVVYFLYGYRKSKLNTAQ